MRGFARKAYRDEIRDMEQPIEQYNHTRNHQQRRDNRPQLKRQNRLHYNDKYRQKQTSDFLGILKVNPAGQNENNGNYRDNYIHDPSKQVSLIQTKKRQQVAIYLSEERAVHIEKLDEQLEQYKRCAPNNYNHMKKQIQKRPITRNQVILDNQEEEKNQEVADLSYTDFKKQKKVEAVKEKQKNLSFSLDEDDDWGLEQDKEDTQILKDVNKSPLRKAQQKKKQKQQGSYSSHRQLNEGFVNKSNNSNQSSDWLDQKDILNQQQQQQQQQQQNSSFSNNDESFLSSVHSNHPNQSSYSHADSHKGDRSSINQTINIEQILKVIDQSSQFQEKDITLNLQVQNTLSLTIKQVFLKKLSMNIKLGVTYDGIIVKNCEIQIQKLTLYISFFQIDIQYPKIYQANKIDDKSFKFCRIKVPPINKTQNKNESKFIKKPKKVMQTIQQTLTSLLKISKIQLKCMNCDKANEVAVIENAQGFNEAGLSCTGCAEKILAKMRFSLEL